LGYRLFRCRPCRRTFNERTGTPFNHLQVPTDIALLVVLWRLRYKLSLRDLAEMFLTRGFTFTHEAVREWEERFAPLLTERLRAKRRGKAGLKWHADELRHEVACIAVEVPKGGLDRAFCRPYPTGACGRSNPAVR
jgi:putative transposase